jgi:hypothetical protein
LNGESAEFPFVVRDPAIGAASLAPMLPMTLQGRNAVEILGLLDTGAAVNVLPLEVGRHLGFDWKQQTTLLGLSGILTSAEARLVIVDALVAEFTPVRLAFAWAETDDVPVVLGQTNFFQEFDACFFRSRAVFEIRRHVAP